MRTRNVERLKRFLAEKGGKASSASVCQHFGWAQEKLDGVVDKSDGHVKRTRGGARRTIALIASEKGCRGGVRVYSEVRRVLKDTWAGRQGWRPVDALDTALNGRAATGRWSRPDCVLVWYPRRRRTRDEPPRLSTFEIEGPGQFSIESVYEAHAQGFGADYSWVVFYPAKIAAPDGLPHRDWPRICAAAAACGVGLLRITNSGDAATWQVERAPVRRTDGDRTEFIRRAIPAKVLAEAGLSVEALCGPRD